MVRTKFRAALVYAALAVGTILVPACVDESFYANTRRYDTYVQFGQDDFMDIVFIIDNSPTMVPKIDFIRQQIGFFVTEIERTKALDWQFSIGTTGYADLAGLPLPVFDCANPANPFTCFTPNFTLQRVAGKTGTNTNFIDLLNNSTGAAVPDGIDDTADDGVENFQTMLQHFAPEYNYPAPGNGCPPSLPNGVQCGHINTVFSFWEEGLEYIFQMVGNSANRVIFSRIGKPMTIILITDSKDSSCQANCTGGPPEPRNDWTPFPISRYVDLLSNVKAGESSYVNFFAVVATKPTDTAPFPTGCSAEYVDDRYVAVANALGSRGFIGNICDLTLSGSAGAFNQVAAILKERGSLFRLSDPPNGNQGLRVFVSGFERPVTDYQLVTIANDSFLKFITNIPNTGEVVSVVYESGS